MTDIPGCGTFETPIDYKATYIYRIGNGRALPTVLHWATLKHSPEYLALTKIN